MTDRPTPTTGSTATEPETPAAPMTKAGRALHRAEMFDLSAEEDRRRLAVAIEAEAAALAARPALDVERLLEDVAARIRSGAYLTYHAGPDNLVRDALDAEYARLASLPTEPEAGE